MFKSSYIRLAKAAEELSLTEDALLQAAIAEKVRLSAHFAIQLGEVYKFDDPEGANARQEEWKTFLDNRDPPLISFIDDDGESVDGVWADKFDDPEWGTLSGFVDIFPGCLEPLLSADSCLIATIYHPKMPNQVSMIQPWRRITRNDLWISPTEMCRLQGNSDAEHRPLAADVVAGYTPESSEPLPKGFGSQPWHKPAREEGRQMIKRNLETKLARIAQRIHNKWVAQAAGAKEKPESERPHIFKRGGKEVPSAGSIKRHALTGLNAKKR